METKMGKWQTNYLKHLRKLEFDPAYKDSIQPYYSKIVNAKNDGDKVTLAEYLIKIYDEQIEYSEEFVQSIHNVINRKKREYSRFTIWITNFVEKYLYWM